MSAPLQEFAGKVDAVFGNVAKLTPKTLDRLLRIPSHRFGKPTLDDYARCVWERLFGAETLSAAEANAKGELLAILKDQSKLSSKELKGIAGFTKAVVILAKTQSAISKRGRAGSDPATGYELRGQKPPTLPPLETVLSHGKPNAVKEFAALMHPLILAEAERGGCVDVPITFWSPHTSGFTRYYDNGRIFGLDPVVIVTVGWGTDETDGFGKAQSLTDFHQVLGEKQIKAKHWVFVSPMRRSGPQWEDTLALLKERGLQVHNFSQAEFEPWLLRCPPLLARYYPDHAAKLANSDGYLPTDFSKLKSDFLARELPRHRELSLLGLPPRFTQHQDKPTPLGDVFVPQKFQTWGTSEPLKSFADILHVNKPCVLLGDPGSGKSTILHFLALLHAGEASLPGMPPQPFVPFFLSLRDFSKSLGKQPSIVGALADEARGRGVPRIHHWFFEALLMMGGAVVLLDGLDEAGDHKTREKVADLIEGFHRQYPACRVWVTSRIVGYADTARLDSKAFTHYSVAEFGTDEQKMFITKWYDIQIQNDDRLRDEKKKRFLKAVREIPSVKRLAGNPLLLTLMALVHHYQTELPRNRGELYEQCVEMLLKHWQVARLESGAGAPKLTLELLQPPITTEGAKKLLSAVALKVQELNQNATDEMARGDIKESLLREICEERRARSLLGKDATPAQVEDARCKARDDIQIFLDYVREKSGLLLWRGGDVFAFTHLSFLEFLAAYQRSGDRSIDFQAQARFFVEKASLPSWREPLIQLLYLLDKGTGETAFVDELLSPEIRQNAPAGFWRTLGVAVSDELVRAPSHVASIFEHLWADWSLEPEFDGDSYSVLRQIAEYSDRPQQQSLKKLLDSEFLKGSGDLRLSALHLRIRLFGWPVECPDRALELASALRHCIESNPIRDWADFGGEILADADPERVASTVDGRELVDWLRSVLLARMAREQLKPVARAKSGRVLGRLGDLRPGVAPQTFEELVKMEFCFVPTTFPRPKSRSKETSPEPDNADFWIARFPVTVAQFRLFATPENYANKEWWTDTIQAGRWEPGRLKVWQDGSDDWTTGPATLESRFDSPNHPIVMANWYEATAWAKWFNHYLHEQKLLPDDMLLRLAKEEEWELAALGGEWVPTPGCELVRRLDEILTAPAPRKDQWQPNSFPKREYPWGNAEPGERANWAPTGIGATSAVGAFPSGRSPVGAEEMAGNVWEWTDSWYDESKDRRVLRGGSWGSNGPGGLRCSYRGFGSPELRYDIYGFRCVVVRVAARG